MPSPVIGRSWADAGVRRYQRSRCDSRQREQHRVRRCRRGDGSQLASTLPPPLSGEVSCPPVSDPLAFTL
jgi:hypothetical protein